MPVDLMYGTPNTPATIVPEYVAKLRASLSLAYKPVRTTTSTQLAMQKYVYDTKVHGQLFQRGDLVWLNSPAVPKGRPKKLHCPWTGPYKIVQRLSDAVYWIQSRGSQRKKMVVHFDRLKPCSPETRLSPLISTQLSCEMTCLLHSHHH